MASRNTLATLFRWSGTTSRSRQQYSNTSPRKPFRWSAPSKVATLVTVSSLEYTAVPKCVPTQLLSGVTTDIQHADKELHHVSFHFKEDGEPTGVAWTFSLPATSTNILDQVMVVNHCTDSDVDYEYKQALYSFLNDQKYRRGQVQRHVQFCGRKSDDDAKKPTCTEHERRALQVMKEMKSTREKRSWSVEDIAKLDLYYKKGSTYKQMSSMKRSRKSIQNMLVKLRASPAEPTTPRLDGSEHEWTSTMVGSQFDARLALIWRGLSHSELDIAWKAVVSFRPMHEWLASISEAIPPEVKILLGSRQCPTFQDLQGLASVDTNDAGVYARLAETRFKAKIPMDRYVYVGSAYRFDGGLNRRISEYKSKNNKSQHVLEMQQQMRTRCLKGPGHFICLMRMRMTSPEVRDIMDVRRTVLVAEAVLTVWLDALQSAPPELASLFPWHAHEKDYMPWSLYNPLISDVTRPTNQSDCIEGDVCMHEETQLR